MRTDITTEQIALYFCNLINKEFQQNKYTKNFFFDFSIIKSELPNDFNENDFMKFIKDTFDIERIRIDDLGFKFRCIGKVIVNKNGIVNQN